MRKWSRRHTLLAGMAVILITNAIALLGAAWNRSGEPESVLKLTQRELRQPNWGLNRENSGIALNLAWRVPLTNLGNVGPNYFFGNDMGPNYFAASGGAPAWLNKAKMESLGFDVPPIPPTNSDDRWVDKQLSKEVLLVLELNGPYCQQALEYAQRYAAKMGANLAAHPNSEQSKRNVMQANEWVKREENENSRLFVVDAGLDQAVLRAKYPDRTRFAILRGKVQPWRRGVNNENVGGYISGLSIDAINVPFEYRTLFERADRTTRYGLSSPSFPFKATVAIGQRLEPWFIDISISEK
ncbi:MAG: DUF4824 family protein [Thiobacillaceae bacterium]